MPPTKRGDLLANSLAERILLIDGATGTLLQSKELDEAAFRGERLVDHGSSLKGNYDILSVTKPDVVAAAHAEYLDAGADIIKTNSFTATRVAQADYELEHLAADINLEAARIARRMADEYTTAAKPRFVAGVIGPTNRSASFSPDVNDPGFRNITFQELVTQYTEAAENLLRGGADFILIETVFDTLNAKAAIFAYHQACRAQHECRWPSREPSPTRAGAHCPGRRPRRSGTLSGTRARCQWGSTARWAQTSSARI